MIYQAHSTKVCGIDEAGRGALAGPLVAAAVILPCGKGKLERLSRAKIKDGKLLTPLTRCRIYQALKKLGAEVLVEVVSTRRINNRGIARANREIIRNLIKKVEADEYIVDGRLKLGRFKDKTHKVRTLVDADATVLPTILAGIVAKVERDKIMRILHRQFPRFGWRHNAGYGTRKHREAIGKFGMSFYHRQVFVTTALHHHPPR